MALQTLHEPTQLPARRYERTLPWMPEEYMRIGDIQLVYTQAGSDYVVRFPGGGKEYLSALRSRGVFIAMPRVMRARGSAA